MKTKVFISFIGMSILLKIAAMLASVSIGNFDHESYLIIGDMTRQGLSVYPSPADLRHPYFPFFLYIEALVSFLSIFGIDPIILLKLFLIPFDLGIAFMVFKLSKRNRTVTTIYLLNPVTLFVTYIHGQFDVIPLFFLVAGIYALQKNQNAISVLHLSMAVFTKTWPVLFLFPLIRRLRPLHVWLLLPAIPVAGVILYALLFQSNVLDIVTTVKNYRGLYGFWGLGQAISLITGLEHANSVRFIRFIFFAVWAWFSIYIHRDSILEEMTLLFLFFYAFSFGFASQYFCWIMPFLVITRPRFWKEYMIGIPCYLLVVYMSWIMPVPQVVMSVLGIGSWLCIVYMFFINMRDSFSYNYITMPKHSSATMQV